MFAPSKTAPHRPSVRRLILVALAGVAVFGPSMRAAHAAFPEKALRIVVGAPAGGTSDLLARLLAEDLGKQLGQTVIVDNKPGAAGMLGAQEVLKSPRDGHTLLVAPSALVSEIPHALKLPIDPAKEFKPLADLGRTGLLFVAAPGVTAANLKDAVAYIKANPGKTSYASYSAGTVSHTLGVVFNKQFGTDMTHAPYRGSPPALADLAGNHVQFMFDGPATSIPQIKGGKIKVIATTAPTRLSVLPDVPTFAELGAPALTETAWIGLWVTPDVPAAAQTALRDATLKAWAQPALRQKLLALGFDMPPAATPEELTRALQVASDKQAATLRAIGFKPE